MVEEKLREFLKGIFSPLREKVTIEDSKKFGGYYINILDLSEPGLFIGKEGTVLRSIQYLLNIYAHKLDEEFPTIILDVNGYKMKQFEMLRTVAINAALRAKRLSEPVELKPMSASARRIIHMTLKNYPDIWTHSIGREPRRRVVVDLKK
jgi:spoIIIJ-associated protein